MDEAIKQIVQELSGIREELKQIKQISLNAHYPEKERESLEWTQKTLHLLLMHIEELNVQNFPLGSVSSARCLLDAIKKRLKLIDSAKRFLPMMVLPVSSNGIETTEGADTLP